MLRLHAGLSTDAALMIRGALQGGRVRSDLQPELAQLLSAADDEAFEAQQRERLAALLRDNPAARGPAIEAVRGELSVRQRFLERRYAELVGRHRDASPASLTDTTLLILLISAAHVGDDTAVDRWSQEVLRRHPRQDVHRWIQELKAAQG